MAKYSIEDTTLTGIADAIRGKTGTSTSIKVSNMASEIEGIGTSSGVDVSGVTATATDVLNTKKFVNASGSLVAGTMPNNGAISKTMDGLNTKSVSIPKGYTSGGTVSLTNDIDNIADTQSSKIAQIKTALEGKAAGGGGVVETCTVTLRGVDMDVSTGILTGYMLTAYENGEIITKQLLNSSFGEQGLLYGTGTVIENVVCGSLITVTSSKPMDMLSIHEFIEKNEDDFGSTPIAEGAEIAWVSTDQKVAVCKVPTTPNCHIAFSLCWSS